VVYEDEATLAIRDVFDVVIESGAWVPALWRLEVANILEMSIRRGRHDAAFRDTTLADLSRLPIRLDPETNEHAWDTTLRLATATNLHSTTQRIGTGAAKKFAACNFGSRPSRSCEAGTCSGARIDLPAKLVRLPHCFDYSTSCKW
jgi:hypothetical protein